ncbi:hypothetical protein SCHPADRAFT_909229 [Schizopora paradoxa]|uniref:RING-type domain-containing protein n=1 Tax=Schizopora paradoxa TaxID=27342 RepID=A0A0H2R8L8_9AGAM|nr:hypothetical protein SCHPADRAFT_909229 [Schizopora paradoxa]
MSTATVKPSATPPKRSGKKMAHGESLNHLLNFSLPPRRSQAPQSLPRRSRKTTNSYEIWNKEKFLNAQYRFVMKPTGDYTVHFADPDIYFQWQDILQVIIPRYSALEAAAGKHGDQADGEGLTTCPICLSTPSAPRMTKCGHVFCFPCVLHYLNVSERSQCPICFDTISDKQLKCVKWFDEASTSPVHTPIHPASSSSSEGEAPKPGSILRMRLIERQQISTLALPRSKTWPSNLIPPLQAPFHFLPDVYRFARFMLATPGYILETLSRDLDELDVERRLLNAHGDDLGLMFVTLAEEKVRRQIEKATALETEQLMDTIAGLKQDLADLELRHSKQSQYAQPLESDTDGAVPAPEAFLATRQSPFTPSLPAKSTSKGNRNQRQRRNAIPPASTYYYYQAASGAPIFLHPLDIRILLARYESYSSFPDEISVRVEAIGEGSIDDDMRRRCKYLAHFPESADVVFIEADLRDVVGAQHLHAFEGALRIRRNKRKEQERKDDRARARAEEHERQKQYTRPVQTESRPASIIPDFVNVIEPVGLGAPAVAEVEPPPSVPQQLAGAWGQRSFASALHSPAPPPGQRARGGQSRAQDGGERDWDIDAAWDDLDVAAPRGKSRRKGGAKLVIIGGVGGRKR